MSRPKILYKGRALYWVITTRNPDNMQQKDADELPVVYVRCNGLGPIDTVSVTKRAGAVGFYDCAYNPTNDVEGDEYTIEEHVKITGSITPQGNYVNTWEFVVAVFERGTDETNIPAAIGLSQPNIDDRFTAIDIAIANVQVDNQAIADAVQLELDDDFAAINAAIGKITIVPAIAHCPQRVTDCNIATFEGDRSAIGVVVFDKTNTPVDLTALGSLEVCIETRRGLDLQTIPPADLLISGTDKNMVTFTPNAAAVSVVEKHRWSLRTVSDKKVIAYGSFFVQAAALSNTPQPLATMATTPHDQAGNSQHNSQTPP